MLTRHSKKGCADLADLYEYGKGVRQDYKTAKEIYGKACDLGSQVGCDGYAKLNKQGFKFKLDQ